MSKVLNERHICSVEKQTSGSFLSPLSKEASWCKRFIRGYKKFIQVSREDAFTQEFFRSTTRLLNERKRHAHSGYSYIIHPFSKFAFYRELILLITLAVTFICAPLIPTFQKHKICDAPWIYVLEVMTTIIFILDIGVKFFVAIENKETEEVILEQKKIVRKYILSVCFILDLVTACSFCIIQQVCELDKYHFLFFFRLLKIFNLKSFLQYWSRIARRWNFSVLAIQLFKYMLTTMILIHWCTCFLYYVSKKYAKVRIKRSSHILSDDYNITSLYITAVFEAMGVLFCARSSVESSSSLEEMILNIVIFTFGKLYMLVLTVSTVNQVLNQWSLETKYLGIVDQLKEFMHYKKLPLNLRQKIQSYFDYKFHHKYFRENFITSIVSDKLKREINIQVFKKIVNQAVFLADLPTGVLGDVLTHLKSEVFLPNDIIIRAGAPGDCMYFLSSGTVVVTTPSGKEVCHLTDGAYFGEIALLSKQTKRTANVIALEICETYRLDQKVFKTSIRKYPECVKVIQTLAEMRHQETNALEELRKEELFHKIYIGENEMLEGSQNISSSGDSSLSTLQP